MIRDFVDRNLKAAGDVAPAEKEIRNEVRQDMYKN